MLAPNLTASLPFHEWASLRTELFWIYDREVRPEHQRSMDHNPVGYRAWLVRRGTVTLTSGRHVLTAGPGMWILPPEGCSVQKLFSRNAHILSLSFLCQWPSGENILTKPEGFCLKAREQPRLESAAKKLERMLRHQFPEEGRREQVYTHQSSDYGTFLHLQSLFFNWLALWFQLQVTNGAQVTRITSGDSRPFQAARCLNTAPLSGKFPHNQLQEQTGLGLMRLNQIFFAEFGLTCRKYWDRRRLEFARQFLETSRMPMKEISYRLGFRSDSHFVVWFRRLAGARPGDYRRNYLATVDG